MAYSGTGMLKQRVITALLLIPVPFAAVWFGEPWFTILVAILGVLAAFEFSRLGKMAGLYPDTYAGIIFALLFIISRNPEISSHLETFFDPVPTFSVLFVLAIVITLFLVLLRRRKEGVINSWACTIAEIVYTGWLFGHLVSLRDVFDGRNWVFFAILATFASDTASFFIGRALGRHRLAPQISPKKTWEGSSGGVAGAIVLSMLFVPDNLFTLTNPFYIPSLNWSEAIFLGALVSIFGQLGDLFESLVKRSAGAKDSSNLLPGHGGILDRLDSIIFAVATVYYFVLFTRGI